MTNQFSPEAQRQYDELVYILRTTLADADADDAIGCLDALLSTHWEDVSAEATERIREQVAREIEAIEPLEWAIAGVRAGEDAARIARGEQQ